MDKPFLPVDEVATYVGVSRKRIQQMIDDGRIQTIHDKGHRLISADDAEVLKREQSFLRPSEVRQRLGVTVPQLRRLIDKKVVKPRNVFSKLALFDPAEIDACIKKVETSHSIEETARLLRVGVRQAYRLIADGRLESIETIHGRRVTVSEINIYITVRWLGSE